MLSVLVPIYNTEKYLGRCIESILTQTYHDFELILVDDGSVDSSGDICDIYATRDSRIKVIHKENGGLGSARLAGLKMAKGEFVAFVDSDDYIESDMYECLMNPLLLDASVDISIGGYVRETDDGDVLYPFDKTSASIYSADKACVHMFENRFFNWSLWDKVYRRDLFEKCHKLCDWPKSYGEDTFANWMLFKESRNVAYQPLYFYHYCIHSASMTQQQSFTIEKLAYLDIWNLILKDPQSRSYAFFVIRLMLEYGCGYIREMQKDWQRYRKVIHTYQSLINTNISKYRYPLTIAEQWKLDFTNRTQYESANAVRKYRYQLKKFINDYLYIFVYGAGIIADEVTFTLEEIGGDYDGYVVSEYGMNDRKIHGKNVYEINQLNVPIEETGFILALNKTNENIVHNKLRSMGYKNMYYAGRESYFYLGSTFKWR